MAVVLASGLAGCGDAVLLALRQTDEPPPAAVGDVPELLNVNVDK
jgi:hypothetical protein